MTDETVPTTPRGGRAVPHSLEAEEYLLGCCLLDGADTIARCLEVKLSPASFYSALERLIDWPAAYDYDPLLVARLRRRRMLRRRAAFSTHSTRQRRPR